MQPQSPPSEGHPRKTAFPWVLPLLQLLSLVATGVLLWNLSIGPRLLWQPLGTVVRTSLLYAVVAWIWSAGISLGLYLMLPRGKSSRSLLDRVLRTSAVGVWFAPATILLSNFSPAALAAGLVLIVTATRLLCSDRQEDAGETLPASSHPLFRTLEAVLMTWTRELALGLAAAFAIQFGVTAALSNLPLASAALFALSAAILTMFGVTTGALAPERPRPLPQSAFGIVLTILMAAGLTVGGIEARKQRGDAGDFGSGKGAAESARDILKSLFEKGKDDPGYTSEGEEPAKPAAASIPFPRDGDFPGVILWPEIRDVPRLVAPVPPNANQGSRFRQRYSIPFGGEYWIYRFLFQRPPANSWRHRGSPAALSFSSTDRSPLLMEAHQKLDPPVDLACCREVHVEIWNADRYPATVSLELFSSDAKGLFTSSLGRRPVLSVPNLNAAEIVAVPETLVFQIPQMAHECGELKVLFTRARSRAEKSARIAIDSFVLIP